MLIFNIPEDEGVKDSPEKFVATTLYSALGFYIISQNIKNRNKTQDRLKDASLSFPQFAKRKHITNDEATQRSKIISHVKYSLTLNLQKGNKYEGHVVVEFHLSDINPGVFLDFCEGDYVKKIVVNSFNATKKENFINRRIQIPREFLKKGDNTIEIAFENEYSKEGIGLHSFTDTDGSQYLFSRSGPVYTHMIFPCFDQPDIKASIKLSVVVPEEWKVLSNESVDKIKQVTPEFLNSHLFSESQAKTNLVEFQNTPTLASYHFVVAAGPYHKVECKSTHRNIKMSVYLRSSLANLDSEIIQLIFDVNSNGIKYFELNLELPYSFPKYDIIFCPELEKESLETPGLNCLSEDWLASQETLDEKLRFYLANELIRKLSLTWFGGSITAKWWNDLWIHEGLSTFLSYHILANSEDFKYKYPNSWFYFFFEKERAYYQDQLSIIHAVAHDVYSTHQAENIQDGIIREKAAAALKQLITAIGIDTFQDALKQLIKEYHSKNIELRDFMKCLQDSLNNRGIEADISRWEAQWLKSPGLNEIEVFADIEEGQLTGINIVQTVATRNLVALRDHRCKLAFFYDNAEESIHSVEITDETITSIELPRMTKPVGILLNYDDEDYVKLRFDRVSFNYFKRSLHIIKDIKTKGLIWRAIVDLVRDGRASGTDFCKFVIQEFLNEDNELLANYILENTRYILHNYIPLEFLAEFSHNLFEVIFNAVKDRRNELGKKFTDLYLYWLPQLVEKDVDGLKLVDFLEDNTICIKAKIEILRLFYAKGLFDAQTRKKLFEKINDGSYEMLIEERRLKASELVDPKEREKLFRSFVKPSSNVSLRMIEASMRGFNHIHNRRKNHEYVEKYFENLFKVYSENSFTYWRSFSSLLFPFWCEDHDFVIDKITKLEGNFPEKLSPYYTTLIGFKDEVLRRKRNKTACLIKDSKSSFGSSLLKQSSKLGESVLLTLELNKSQDVTGRHQDATSTSQEFIGTYSKIPEYTPVNDSERDSIKSKKISEIEEPPEHPSFLSSDRHDIEDNDDDEIKSTLNKSWKKSGLFEKSQSVFKDWVTISSKNLKDMFQADVSHFNLDKVIVNGSELKAVLDNLYQKHYLRIFLVFLHYQSECKKYPEISFIEFNQICKNAKKVFGAQLTQTDLDRLIIQQTRETPKAGDTSGKDRTLSRFEFVEILVRMALKKHMKGASSYNAAIDKFFDNDFFPNVLSADYAYEGYRYEKVQVEAVDNVLKNNEKTLKAIFDKFKSPNRDYITRKEIHDLVDRAKLGIIEEEVIKCFALSKMPIIDELNPGNRTYETLHFIEFLEFVVRLSEIYDDQSPNPTYQKVEDFIPILAKVL